MDTIPAVSVKRVRGKLARPGCELYYEVTGEGPALVFAHGLGGNHLSWWQQVPVFCDRYSCITFAHRGFAPSGAIAGGPDPNDYGDDLAALLDHLGFAETRIVAQSMGGWTATGFALKAPARVKALVMACTTGVFDFRKSAKIDQAALAAWDASAERTASEGFARGVHPAGGARMAREQPALHFLYREIDDQNRELDKMALRQLLHATRSRSPRDAAAFAFPTLFITGEEDLAVPPAGVAAIAAEFPNARLERVPAAGHSVYFERAAHFNRVVAAFLDEVR
jgi:pimeloyl-ACP methyl ester carboxylesterase